MPYLAEGVAKSGRATGKFRTIVPFKRCLLPCPLPRRASTFFDAHWHHEPDDQVSLSPGVRDGVRGKAPYKNEGVGKTHGPGCSVSEVVCWLKLGRSLSPHPYPLPKGEGAHLTLSKNPVAP